VAWLVVADRERLDAREQLFVDALMASSPELSHLISLAREFRTFVRQKEADRLDAWPNFDSPIGRFLASL
jgi:hypothetical protein